MPLSNPEVPQFLKSGDKAHLIPVVKDSNKEVRAMSSLLATMKAVNEFGKDLLEFIGAPITKRSKISCFTEIVFKDSTVNDKPDGLIIVENGPNTWTALVEAKVGNNKLVEEQIERYLDLARAHNIDALITISNQLVVLPTFNPLPLPKQKVKNVDVHHMSWTFIVTEALLLLNNKLVASQDQAYILSELIRYLQHDSEIINPFKRMPPSWKELCLSYQQALPISKNSPLALESMDSWQQLIRFLALQMSIAVGRTVSLYLTKAQKTSKEALIQDGLSEIIEKGKLKAEFTVPDAAARIRFVADLKRRTLAVSMKVEAPGDKVHAKASINWLLKQLEKCTDNDACIVAFWPGKTPQTHTNLGKLKEDGKVILSENTSVPPVAFVVLRTIDLAGKFSGVSTFVEEAEKLLPSFYHDIGQLLQSWKPLPPKVITSKPEEILENIYEEAKTDMPDKFFAPVIVPQHIDTE